MSRAVLIAPILAAVLAVGAPGGVSAGREPAGAAPVKSTALPAGAAAGRYWVREYRRRWLAERQDGAARAQTIRALRRGLRARGHGHSYLEGALLCIQTFEAPWAYDGPVYDGGLQMDADFQRTYGREFVRAFGAASNWPVSVQLAVGIRGWIDRGWAPWPNTARRCGLW